MSTSTTNLALTKPAVNDAIDADLWGGYLNTNLDTIDSEAATRTINQNFADKVLSRPEIKDYAETLNAAGNITGSVTVDYTNGNHYEGTLTGNVTFTFSNPPATGRVGVLVLYLKQDGTGSRTVTWPASVVWSGGTAPTLTTTASKTDIFTFITRDAGTTWAGFTGGLNFTI